MSRRRNRRPTIAHAVRHNHSGPCKVLTPAQLRAAFPPTVQAAVSLTYQTKPPCLLCQQPCYRVGIFVPFNPRAYGMPPGWRGGCVYSLCRTCLRLPDLMDRIETLLWQDRGQAAASWN